jgi:hypothetical protein
MDPAFQAYKNKTEKRIAIIIGESLQSLTITEDDAEEMGKYILDNIDLIKTNSELLDFVTKLSAKWPIFNSILTSPDQTQTPPAADATQEKTDQIIHATEDLLKENKIDEALQVAKTGTEPAAGTGGII